MGIENLEVADTLRNVFTIESSEKQCSKNKAVKNDIDEWMNRAGYMIWSIINPRRCCLLDA